MLQTKLSRELVVYQVQFQLNQLIQVYGYNKILNMFNNYMGDEVMYRHYSNLVLTYGFNTVWTVIELTFGNKLDRKVG